MFFNKKIDTELKGISELLFLDVSNRIEDKELLTSKNLDYSIGSIKHIEKYLDSLKGTSALEEYFKDFALKGTSALEEHSENFVLRIGAYVGEVIKRFSTKDYHWYNFETVLKWQPQIKVYEDPVETQAVLYSKTFKQTLFPLVEVCKYLDNSSEHGLFTYVQSMTQ